MGQPTMLGVDSRSRVETDASPNTSRSGPLPQVRIELQPFVSLATQQAGIKLVREIRIDNLTPEDLVGVELHAGFDPAFATPKIWRIPRIPAGESITIEDRRVRLSAGYLASVTDSFSAEVVLELFVAGRRQGEWSRKLDVLGRTHWGGYAARPELLTAFCLPNDPAVAQVLSRASIIMRDEGRSPSLTGYDGRSPDRVREMTNAVWSAVASIGIEYAYPQVSFDARGQRIRPPSVIANDKLATCLDLALLFCAALEQAYLHPVIVLEKTHAYAGVHLVPTDLQAGRPVLSKLAEVRRRLRAGTLLLFETTLVTTEPKPFEQATQSARRAATRLCRNRFEYLVDVKACRMARIMPLVFHQEPATIDLASAGPRIELDGEPVASTTSRTDRLDKWKAKLLDLSPRNPLIDCPVERVVPLDVSDPAHFLGLVAASPARIAATEQQDTIGNRLIAPSRLRDAELDRRLMAIRRRDRDAREEGGASVLFLTAGRLHWCKREATDRQLSSPLLMIPLRLRRESLLAPWEIECVEGPSFLNPALGAALDREFEIGIDRWEGIQSPCAIQEIEFDAFLDRVRKHLRNLARSSVTSDMTVGVFEFRKLFMWRDLIESSHQLVQNRTLRHIADSPTQPYVWGTDIPSPEQLDDIVDPLTMFAPLSTDASQLSAVVASRNDVDFVMIGPPGTGKSQTIANIIAQGIADGKRVLLSAQKKVALDVVYSRLKELGLHRFCLHVRPGHRETSDAIRQLKESWLAASECDEGAPAPQHVRLSRLQERLNSYPEAIHEKHPNGLTVHWALGALADSRDLPQFDFAWPTIGAHDAEEWEEMASATTKLGALAREELREPLRCLELVNWSEWSRKWEETLLSRAQEMIDACHRLEGAAESLLAELGATKSELTFTEVVRLSLLATSIQRSPELNLGFVFSPHREVIVDSAKECVRLSRVTAKLKSRLSTEYRADVLMDVDLGRIRELALSRHPDDRKTAENKWREEAGPVDSFEIENDVDTWIKINEARQAIRDLAEILREFPAWRGTGTDHELETVSELADVAETLIAATDWVKRELRDLVSPGEPLLGACQGYEEGFRLWSSTAGGFGKLAGRDLTLSPRAFRDLRDLMALLDELQTHKHRIPSRCVWNLARDEARSFSLSRIAEALMAGTLRPADSRRAFEVNYARWWLRVLIDGDRVLHRFTGIGRAQEIEDLRTLTSDTRDLLPARIRSRLRGNVPSINHRTLSTHYATLKRETAKRRRFKSLRRLFVDAEEAISELTPCMLMSPIAAARHLGPGRTLFDLVIIDEASQLPVSEAVGVVGRGRQTIVVGDPMQLPPSRFFEANWDDPEDADPDRADLDSILDEVIGASLPAVSLNWHYRSQFESLIHFSNDRYYDRRLITLPTPTPHNEAVRYLRVHGDYRPGPGTNAAEARALVREILARLDEAHGGQAPSMGVVTFNQAQRDLVEALLNVERERHPALNAMFQRRFDHLFIKNIENAQGDERDIVFLGVTYGPDADGHLSLNFGPLNVEGGERRLNVAITRARQELVVLSSFDPEAIEIARTPSRGVRDLRAFLEYARGGAGAPKTIRDLTDRSTASPFEVTIARAIEDMGWTAHLHVGEQRLGGSGHVVDIGVVDPRNPDRYVAGVECDGETYSQYHTASDRDVLRPAVLRQRGWNLIRVWSLDYYLDPVRTMQRVAQAIHTLCGSTDMPLPK